MKKLRYWALFLGFALIFFDLQYFLMSRLPGSKNEMCIVGAGLTIPNLLFAGLLSVFFGIFFLSIVELMRSRRSQRMGFADPAEASTASGLGFILGTLTLFCPTCTFPALSLFGLSFGFGIFTDYNLTFKILSLSFMTLALYKMSPKLKELYSDYSS